MYELLYGNPYSSGYSMIRIVLQIVDYNWQAIYIFNFYKILWVTNIDYYIYLNLVALR